MRVMLLPDRLVQLHLLIVEVFQRHAFRSILKEPDERSHRASIRHDVVPITRSCDMTLVEYDDANPSRCVRMDQSIEDKFYAPVG